MLGTAAIWTAPKQIGSIAGVTRMALSEAALCVMTADAIACRGLPHLDPESGQLRSDAAWRTLAASADAIDLDVQGSTVCALRRTGHVECRDLTRASGSDRLDGHVGDAVELALPTQGGSLYVRTRAGEIRCLGPPDECVDTSALHGTSRIAAGSRHLCALSSGGLVQCAGDNTQGQLGGVSNRPSEPVTLAGSYLAIAAYRHRTCAITATERAVMCWGATPGQRATEVRPVDGLEGPAVALAVSASHVCVALADGTIKCRGARDRNGELGSGRAVVVPRPRRLNTLVDIQ